MEINAIIQQLVSGINYYEKLPCIKVNGSELFETDNKYIHKDSRRLKELNIINPLKKIMTDSNLTDNLDYSSLGVTISKSVNQLGISAVSKKYILFVSQYLRKKKNLTSYISVAELVKNFIQSNEMSDDDLYSFQCCVNDYFHLNLYLFAHNKLKQLYLKAKNMCNNLYDCLCTDNASFVSNDNIQLNQFCEKTPITFIVINDYLNERGHKYTKALSSAIVDFCELYVNIENVDDLTKNAINKILDILEDCNQNYFFKLVEPLNDINKNIEIITADLENYIKTKSKGNERTIKRVKKIIDAFENAESFLLCDYIEISTRFFIKYLSSLIYEHYFNFYSIFKMNAFCIGCNFNELAEYLWNNPHDADEIYMRIQNKLKDQDFICIDFTEKSLDIPDFDEADFTACKLITNISFIYPCTKENSIYNTIEETLKDGKK